MGSLPEEIIKSKIHTIRNKQVMLDSDLAELYGVETKQLKRAVNRNIHRFPVQFMFELTSEELQILRCQFGTSSWGGGDRYLPYVFTEQGVAMLSAVLRSTTAIQISIQIMDAFVQMRYILKENAHLERKIQEHETKFLTYDSNFKIIFNAIEDKQIKPKQQLFFENQHFDAYTFVSELIKEATISIILIDNFVDDTVLTLLTKRNKNVTATILTKNITKQLLQDLEKHNQQYIPITLKKFKKSHDRFLIIDNTIYHFGASIKDLGKSWSFCSKFDNETAQLLLDVKNNLFYM